MRDALGRIQGEVFIYDDVPGGAGYARVIHDSLQEVAELAMDMGGNCYNQDCSGACYHCLLGYSNQYVHNILDRSLGAAVLDYILNGQHPDLPGDVAESAISGLAEYIPSNWTVSGPGQAPQPFDAVLSSTRGPRVGVQVIHPISARPAQRENRRVRQDSGILVRAYTSFDLLRRPFWVANDLISAVEG